MIDPKKELKILRKIAFDRRVRLEDPASADAKAVAAWLYLAHVSRGIFNVHLKIFWFVLRRVGPLVFVAGIIAGILIGYYLL